jgi:dihydrofolate synthase / folylpolyglutamate synthase
MSCATPSTSYEDAIANLSSLIPELFTAPRTNQTDPTGGSTPIRRKFSLDEIGALSTALGNPHQQFPSILIAGTNGKGSTASTLASIARAAGLRVGLYTSPHLERVNEPIRLGLPGPGSTSPAAALAEIPDPDFARLYFRVHDTAQQLVHDSRLPSFPSYFELLTALAFGYFAESKVDLAVLEVGMGGRLDATNLVHPILSIITDISLDHQEWLGSTIDLIAREKAGILRPNGILITLPQHPEANQALGEAATELNVRGVSATGYIPSLHTSPTQPYELQVMGQTISIDSPLHGAHQHRNLALAIAAAVELAQHHNFPITAASIAQGIHATQWPGRLESITIPASASAPATQTKEAIPASPLEFLLDVAHNPAGAWALRSALNSPESPRCLIFACLRDKPLREMAQILFPIFDHVILAPIRSPRASEVADLLAAAQDTGVPSTSASTVEEAIAIAQSLHPARIVISGSVYLVGEARALLLNHKARQVKS